MTSDTTISTGNQNALHQKFQPGFAGEINSNIEVSQFTSAQSQYADLFPSALLELLLELHTAFEPERQRLLSKRRDRQDRYDAGEVPQFTSQHPAHQSEWRVAPIPADLMDRRVEITGPISNRKMVLNMLSPNQDGVRACTAMLDFEDSMAPTWKNVVSGIENIIGVANLSLTISQNQPDGSIKTYRLDPKNMAHPMVRVRGLHMNEKNVLINDVPMAAGMFDLATTAFHTAKIFLASGKTPKFYVPKCEHFEEARWWNLVFRGIEKKLSLADGALKATFLIETLPAAFQMKEILFELRERVCGLNGGRWDKIFSDIKTLKMHSDRVLANRSVIDMSQPWMDQYAKLLIRTCHQHGAFAMGGMSAFTPGQEPEVRQQQTAKVIADKKRESEIGHDGCWVSHPYFITLAKAQFTKGNQLDVLPKDLPERPDLLPKSTGPKTLDGLKQNLRVGIAYQHGWDQGIGCVAFENLMEDLATLEISRAQVWQWLHHRVILDDGTAVTSDLVKSLFQTECDQILKNLNVTQPDEKQKYIEAKNKIEKVFLRKELDPFFTTIN